MAFKDMYNVNSHFGRQGRHFRTFCIANVIPPVEIPPKTAFSFFFFLTFRTLVVFYCVALLITLNSSLGRFHAVGVAYEYVTLRIKIHHMAPLFLFLAFKDALSGLSLQSCPCIMLNSPFCHRGDHFHSFSEVTYYIAFSGLLRTSK